MQCKAANELYTMKRTIILLAAVLMPLLASAQLNITSETQTYKTLASARVGNVKLDKGAFGYELCSFTKWGRVITIDLGATPSQARESLEDLLRLINTMKGNDYVTLHSHGHDILIWKVFGCTLGLENTDQRYKGEAYLYRGEIKKFLKVIKQYESTTN